MDAAELGQSFHACRLCCRTRRAAAASTLAQDFGDLQNDVEAPVSRLLTRLGDVEETAANQNGGNQRIGEGQLTEPRGRMPLRQRKIALISHSYVESASRTKLTYLAEATDLRLITPSSYPTPYGLHALDSEFNSGVTIQSYPIQFLHFKRTPTRWLLRSRDLGFRQFQPDIIHVEMEPHGWITCQVLLYRRLFAPKAKVIIFSWENLTLEEQGTKARTLEYLSRFNRRFLDFFICGNIAGKQILVSKGIAAAKIAVLPQCGVDQEAFCPYSPEQRAACRLELGILQTAFAIG